MAYSFLVLAETKKLPAPEALAAALADSGFPARIDTDWQWKNLGGWLPIAWQSADTGCEVEFEAIEAGEAEAAAKAGFAHCDVQLEFTTRGWQSLSAAVVFAGTVAKLSNGCVSDSEHSYIDADSVDAWMTSTIQAAERGAAAIHAKKPAGDSADREATMSAVLAQIAGPVTGMLLFNDSLTLRLENNSHVKGNMWKLRVGADTYDVTRWRQLKQRETDLLLEDGVPDEIAMQRADALSDDIRDAKTLDEQDYISAYAFLKAVDDLTISEARVISDSSVEVKLGGDIPSVLQLFADAYLATIDVQAGSDTAQINAPLPVL